MAIKKKVATSEVAEINIEQAADLFQKYALEKKEIEKKEKQYKEMLIAYCEKHPEKFEGKTLKFPNGVYVEQREKLSATYNDEAISTEWIQDFVRYGGGDAISVKFDDKKVVKMNRKEILDLLYAIEYEVSYDTTYAAYAK